MKITKVPHSDEVAAAVKANGGYCVCAVEKTPDTKCMCKEFKEQVIAGTCHCGLYRKG